MFDNPRHVATSIQGKQLWPDTKDHPVIAYKFWKKKRKRKQQKSRFFVIKFDLNNCVLGLNVKGS